MLKSHETTKETSLIDLGNGASFAALSGMSLTELKQLADTTNNSILAGAMRNVIDQKAREKSGSPVIAMFNS